MNDVKKFKDLLAYFVVHLEYVQTGKTNGIGYDKFLKPLEPLTVDNDFYKTGQGYNNDNIQHQIEDWQEINGFLICINVQSNFGTYQSKKCYLNLIETGINIFADWDNDRISSLSIGYCYWWENGQKKYKTLKSWDISSLMLFDDADSPELNLMYDSYLKEVTDYDSETGDYYLQERGYYAKKESQKKMDRYKEYIEILRTNKNLVLTGAPGTGKTFMAHEIAKVMEAEVKFVQFHPSYDYTDFVEGLRPVDNGNGQMGFERKDGVFKEFCKDAIKNIVDSEKSVETLTKEQSWQDKLEQFVEDAMENDKKFKTVNGSEFSIADMKSHTIVVHNEQNEKTTDVTVNADEILDLLTQEVELKIVRDIKSHYGRKYGTQPDSYAFVIVREIRAMDTKVSVVTADEVKKKPFVLIIDEINRGEASKIFGELFYAIDPGYRGKTDVKVQTQYQNLIPESDVFAKGFYVPDNVYILATMNDIDRSVESMDFAMRRRFTWKEVKPVDTQDMLDTLDDDIAGEAKERMKRLNDAISESEGLGSAYMIGPSYFLKLKDNGGDFSKLWEMNLEPLLREYLRGFRKVDDKIKGFKAKYDNKAVEETTTDASDIVVDED